MDYVSASRSAAFDFPSIQRKLEGMMLPDWPGFAGGAAHWLLLGVKVAAALGFVAAADLVILYAS